MDAPSHVAYNVQPQREAPILRLPLELLSIILRMHVLENYQSQWIPMFTCRTLRAAATLTRDLWNCITLYGESRVLQWRINEPFRRFSHYSLCRTEEQLLRALKRAGTTPLDLNVVPKSPKSYFTPMKAEESYKLVVKLLKIIERQHQTPRVRSLRMDSGVYRVWTEAPQDLFSCWDFSQLESLDTWAPHLINRAIQESKRLRFLGIPRSGLEQIQDAKWRNIPLRLKLFGRYNSYFTPETVSTPQALSGFRGVIDLELSIKLEKNAPRVRMEQLQTLKLDEAQPLWPIDCPNLVHLQIVPPDDVYYTGDIIFLSSLSTLECVTSWDSRRLSLLRFFDAPNLKKLDFEVPGHGKQVTYNALHMIWPSAQTNEQGQPIGQTSHRLDPRILTFTNTNIGEKSLANLLCRLNRCEEINLIDTVCSASFIDGLCPKSQKGQTVPLPVLQRVTMDVSKRRRELRVNEAEVVDAATRLGDARGAVGRPLVRFTLANRGSWTSLVFE